MAYVTAEINETQRSEEPTQQGRINDVYATDEFRMFCTKICMCSTRAPHDWSDCPYAHPGEVAKRRDIRKQYYSSQMCPDVEQKRTCPKGDDCQYSHNLFEAGLHPERYRTIFCSAGPACQRRLCFFAHTFQELRKATRPTHQFVTQTGAQAGPSAAAATLAGTVAPAACAGAKQGDVLIASKAPSAVCDAARSNNVTSMASKWSSSSSNLQQASLISSGSGQQQQQLQAAHEAPDISSTQQKVTFLQIPKCEQAADDIMSTAGATSASAAAVDDSGRPGLDSSFANMLTKFMQRVGISKQVAAAAANNFLASEAAEAAAEERVARAKRSDLEHVGRPRAVVVSHASLQELSGPILHQQPQQLQQTPAPAQQGTPARTAAAAAALADAIAAVAAPVQGSSPVHVISAAMTDHAVQPDMGASSRLTSDAAAGAYQLTACPMSSSGAAAAGGTNWQQLLRELNSPFAEVDPSSSSAELPPLLLPQRSADVPSVLAGLGLHEMTHFVDSLHPTAATTIATSVAAPAAASAAMILQLQQEQQLQQQQQQQARLQLLDVQSNPILLDNTVLAPHGVLDSFTMSSQEYSSQLSFDGQAGLQFLSAPANLGPDSQAAGLSGPLYVLGDQAGVGYLSGPLPAIGPMMTQPGSMMVATDNSDSLMTNPGVILTNPSICRNNDFQLSSAVSLPRMASLPGQPNANNTSNIAPIPLGNSSSHINSCGLPSSLVLSGSPAPSAAPSAAGCGSYAEPGIGYASPAVWSSTSIMAMSSTCANSRRGTSCSSQQLPPVLQQQNVVGMQQQQQLLPQAEQLYLSRLHPDGL